MAEATIAPVGRRKGIANDYAQVRSIKGNDGQKILKFSCKYCGMGVQTCPQKPGVGIEAANMPHTSRFAHLATWAIQSPRYTEDSKS